MKRMFSFLMTLVLAIGMFTSAAFAQEPCEGGPWFGIYAGQHMFVGSAGFHNDDGRIVITLFDDYEIVEAHVHVANELDGIPQTKKGNPIPGQFAFGYENHTGVNELIVTRLDYDPEEEVVLTDDLYVAVHLVVRNTRTGEETAWAGGCTCGGYVEDFPGANWATYFFIPGIE